MAGLLVRVVSLSYSVDEELLDCLERGVIFTETAHAGGEDFLE